jgi:hypothetical protein
MSRNFHVKTQDIQDSFMQVYEAEIAQLKETKLKIQSALKCKEEENVNTIVLFKKCDEERMLLEREIEKLQDLVVRQRNMIETYKTEFKELGDYIFNCHCKTQQKLD